MLLEDIKLIESIDFGVTTTEPHPEFGEVHTHVGKYEKVPCSFCDASGKDRWYYDPETKRIYDKYDIDELPDEIRNRLQQQDCEFCHGSGKYEEFISDGPEMSLSNRNAKILIELLGYKFDYGGTIFNKELPKLRQRIIRIINSDDISKATLEPTTTGGDVKRDTVKRDDGTTQIVTRKTSTMHDFGLPKNQIMRYLETILEMIDYAQKNGYNIGWS